MAKWRQRKAVKEKERKISDMKKKYCGIEERY
jgi:hypothetical protein